MNLKKCLCIVLVIALIVPLLACGCRGNSFDSATVTFPRVSDEREAAERAGALAVTQYIYARIKTEALIEYDPASGSTQELSRMVDETLAE